MPVVHERRSYFPPWAWAAIALGLLLVVLLVWFVAAGTRQSDEERYGVQPAPSPAPTSPGTTPYSTPAPGQQPSVTPTTPAPSTPSQPSVGAEKPVHVYIHEREREAPTVVIIEEGQEPPSGKEGYRIVDVPGEFNLFGHDWRADQGSVITVDVIDLSDTGQMVEGQAVYSAKDDQKPYDALYIETTPGSGKYINYEQYQ